MSDETWLTEHGYTPQHGAWFRRGWPTVGLSGNGQWWALYGVAISYHPSAESAVKAGLAARERKYQAAVARWRAKIDEAEQ